MKKILNFILILIIVLGLSSCTDSTPLETRLDELELQLEALQTEMDAKNELLDSISLNIATLNENGYDDTSVLELIDSLQLWQDNYIDNDTLYDDTTVLELIESLQLWQDNNVDNDTVYDDTIVLELIASLELWLDKGAYNSTVQSDLAVFKVEVDYIEINSTQEVISVTVEITAKTEMDIQLGTSSYGESGIIKMRVINVEDETVFLYSELYAYAFNAAILDVHLDESEKLTRTLQFTRNPSSPIYGDELESPVGLYRVEVGLNNPDFQWIYTDIIINVT